MYCVRKEYGILGESLRKFAEQFLQRLLPEQPHNQCHAEGGATKGGVSKCEQTQTNADKRKQTQRRKRKQTRADMDKRKQTLTPPPFNMRFFTPPFAIPLHKRAAENGSLSKWRLKQIRAFLRNDALFKHMHGLCKSCSGKELKGQENRQTLSL